MEIDGKIYVPVKDRVLVFWKYFWGYSLTTELIKHATQLGQSIVIRASIKDRAGTEIASGYSESVRGDGAYNSAAPMESAETKAIGRALAVFGLGGREFASADELRAVAAKAKPMGSDQGLSPEPDPLRIRETPKQSKAVGAPVGGIIDDMAGPRSSDDRGENPELQMETVQAPDGEERVNKGWDAVADSLVMAAGLQENLEELNQSWAANKLVIYEMKKDHPLLYAKVAKAYKERKQSFTKEIA